MVQSLFWRRSPSPSQSACPAAWAEALCSIIQAGRLFWLDARWTKKPRPRGMTRKGYYEKIGGGPQGDRTLKITFLVWRLVRL